MNRQINCQIDKKSHFCHLLLLTFNQGQKTSESTKDNYAMYKEDAVDRCCIEKPRHRNKKDLQPIKTMNSVWWDRGCLINWEVFGKNMTVERNPYKAPLHRASEAIQQKI